MTSENGPRYFSSPEKVKGDLDGGNGEDVHRGRSRGHMRPQQPGKNKMQAVNNEQDKEKGGSLGFHRAVSG